MKRHCRVGLNTFLPLRVTFGKEGEFKQDAGQSTSRYPKLDLSKVFSRADAGLLVLAAGELSN